MRAHRRTQRQIEPALIYPETEPETELETEPETEPESETEPNDPTL